MLSGYKKILNLLQIISGSALCYILKHNGKEFSILDFSGECDISDQTIKLFNKDLIRCDDFNIGTIKKLKSYKNLSKRFQFNSVLVTDLIKTKASLNNTLLIICSNNHEILIPEDDKQFLLLQDILSDNIFKTGNHSTFEKSILEEIVQEIDTILYSTDVNGEKYYFISDSVTNKFGFTPEEIYKNKITLLRGIAPEYIPKIKEFLDNLKNGNRAEVEFQFKDKNGKELYLRQTGIPIYENDKVVKIVGRIYDITDEKIMLSKIESSEEKFRMLIETADDFIFTLDKNGNFVSINNNGALSLNYTPGEMKGKHFLELIDEESKLNVTEAFQKLLNSNEIISFDAKLIGKLGNKTIFEIQALPTRNDNQVTGMLGIGRNVTSRMEDELKLKELNTKLIEANRIISIERDRAKQKISVLEEINKLKNSFISNVSHEFRTPLASIVGFAETIESDPDLPREMAREFNNIILTEGKRLAKLINEILDFSHLEAKTVALSKSELDIIKLLNSVINNYTTIAEEKEISLTYELPDSKVNLDLDKDRICTVIGNLLSNAVKFTNPGGRIKIIFQDLIHEIEIIISDTGIGIPASEIPKLFEKFSTIERPGVEDQGVGFGLVAVKQIIDLHKGLINVKSEINKGTTFIIRLPKNN